MHGILLLLYRPPKHKPRSDFLSPSLAAFLHPHHSTQHTAHKMQLILLFRMCTEFVYWTRIHHRTAIQVEFNPFKQQQSSSRQRPWKTARVFQKTLLRLLAFAFAFASTSSDHPNISLPVQLDTTNAMQRTQLNALFYASIALCRE